jgi:GTPase
LSPPRGVFGAPRPGRRDERGTDPSAGPAPTSTTSVPAAGAAGGPARPDPQRPVEADSTAARRCGLVAIVGRPNVGKSTLLNALVGQKISITSRKAQTTRHRITGIRTSGATQFVFVDTPGFQTKHGTALHRTLNRTVVASLADVDAVLFVVEAGRFGLDDAKVLALLPPGKPTLLIANKLDKVKRRRDLLPWLKSMQQRHAFTEFVPMSAQDDADVRRLFEILAPHLPEGPWLHEEDALTDRSDRFLASEIIREKLFRLTGDELPYSCTVLIDRFEEIDDHQSPPVPASADESAAAAGPGTLLGHAPHQGLPPGSLRRIAATIVVEREAHKGMVVGAGGERLKRIGSEARRELEQLLGAKVFLELWVKVRSGWADDEAHLRSYGYD